MTVSTAKRVYRTARIGSTHILPVWPQCRLTMYGHIETAEQRTVIQQYGDL